MLGDLNEKVLVKHSMVYGFFFSFFVVIHQGLQVFSLISGHREELSGAYECSGPLGEGLFPRAGQSEEYEKILGTEASNTSTGK